MRGMGLRRMALAQGLLEPTRAGGQGADEAAAERAKPRADQLAEHAAPAFWLQATTPQPAAE